MKSNRNPQRGFSLIELLVVVAILLVIAAIALPALANSMRASRESAAASSLRSLNTAEESYKQTWGTYSTNAANMSGDPTTCSTGAVSATAACDIADKTFATAVDGGGGTKANYTFKRTQTGNTFLWIASPAGGLLDGRRQFCVVQGGTLHATAPGDFTSITDAASCTGAASL